MKRILVSVLVVVALAALGFVLWASWTSPILPSAVAALQSGNGVEVVSVTSGDWLIFQPTRKDYDTALIFYPGGQVDPQAYAPYAHDVASQGFLVVIPRMPLNLAVFDVNAADSIRKEFPQIQHWAIGGHSLGGVMATSYAVSHADQIEGLVLLASYPASSDSLVHSTLRVVSIYGTNDGLSTGEKIDASRALLPKDTQFVAIEGGNHAQFGDYGVQQGDGQATISREEQQRQTIIATVKLLRSLGGE